MEVFLLLPASQKCLGERVESGAQLMGGRSRHEIRYGLTSLPAAVASPERLLALVRGQWGIEIV